MLGIQFVLIGAYLFSHGLFRLVFIFSDKNKFSIKDWLSAIDNLILSGIGLYLIVEVIRNSSILH